LAIGNYLEEAGALGLVDRSKLMSERLSRKSMKKLDALVIDWRIGEAQAEILNTMRDCIKELSHGKKKNAEKRSR